MNDTLQNELQTLAAQQMKRELRRVEQNEAAQIYIQGKSYLNFSSNDYLGLSRHPRVIEAVQEVAKHWGAGATSSRLIGGNSVIHQDLEQALASFMGTEAALVFPTGYMANLGVITTLASEGDAVILDRLCHASLIDAARLSGARLFVYEHGDTADAEKVLKRAASYRRRLLVTESLFSMDGDFAPLAALAALAQQYEAISVSDEAHAIGVWGDQGKGARWDQGNGGSVDRRNDVVPPFLRTSVPDVDVVIGTLSKSLGSQGGFVCGSQALVDSLVNKARSFIFTTGLSPLCVAAAHAALSLIQEDATPRTRVQDLAKRLREGLRARGFDILQSESQIVPVLLGTVDTTLAGAARLESAGIYAPAIRPPTVHAGACRLRFSVTANHTEKDIDQLLGVL